MLNKIEQPNGYAENLGCSENIKNNIIFIDPYNFERGYINIYCIAKQQTQKMLSKREKKLERKARKEAIVSLHD
jgi:hypothetical protein